MFLLLALLVDEALQANDRSDQAFMDVLTPERELIGPIPSCHDDLYIGKENDCTELLFAPDVPLTRMIMKAVVDNNVDPITGQRISITATAFPTEAAIQDYFLANPDFAIGAVLFAFNEPDPDQLSGFVVQTNTTVKFFKSTFQNPNTFVQLPLQSAVHREVTKHYMRQQGASTAVAAERLQWILGVKAFPHPPIATVSVLGQVLGPFVFAAAMFSFVTQISTVVQEKELGLRQALRTMGMKDSSYWLSWAAWEVTLAFIAGHLITIFGLILQFKLFHNNSYGILFFLFFLFQLAMSSLALFLTTFIRRTQIAVYVGFVMFIVGWIMQTVVIFGVPYTPDFYGTGNYSFTAIFSMFPWTLLTKGFADLGAATISDTSPGLQWGDRKSYCRNDPNGQPEDFQYNPTETYVSFECVMPLNTIFWIYVAEWIGYLLLAVFFDNVLPNEYGVRRSVFYLFSPSYWMPHRAAKTSLRHVLRREAAGPALEGPVDEDVQAEESKMRSLLQHRTGTAGELAGHVEQRNAVELYGLKRFYKGKRGCFGRSCKWCCESCNFCNCEATKDFWAIRDSWFSIAENQLFCLLGPNGAGKTTTINTLTGVLPPSHGDALVYGESIRSATGMDQVRSMMGVCPQFDVLWPELSGREHLVIYGAVKGLPWGKVKEEANELLEKVKLTSAATQQTGAYSGGMKRRLSVAIALLGNPRIVYLDEPTTGMDPISRRYVWDIIEESKVGRAIVLTTHSMEEADILGDRIAIMAKGRLRCIGSSIHLKHKFGSGYQVAISVMPAGTRSQPNIDMNKLSEKSNAIRRHFKEYLGLSPSAENRMYIEYLVSKDQEHQLVELMRMLESQRASLGITDIQLSLTSLEEVFLNIAKQAELENARVVPVTLPDGSTLNVRAGEELVTDARSGARWRILWEQDESGNLVVSDCTLAGATHAPSGSGSHGASRGPSHVPTQNAPGVDAAFLAPQAQQPHAPAHNGAGATHGNGTAWPSVSGARPVAEAHVPGRTTRVTPGNLLGSLLAAHPHSPSAALRARHSSGFQSHLPVAEPIHSVPTVPGAGPRVEDRVLPGTVGSPR